MPLVLGIDSAWTPHGSSGVCLLRVRDECRQVLNAASSYAAFIDPDALPKSPRTPDALALLRAAEERAGAPVDVVAIDMPLSRVDIVGRRFADNLVSKEFASKWAGTHSPTPLRPGVFGRQLREQFERAGYALATRNIEPLTPTLIEVYPLAALVSYLRLDKRPTYKCERISRYWRKHNRAERIEKLLKSWRELRHALAAEIDDVPNIPPFDGNSRSDELKQYEDKFDAVLCAWIGACFIEGRVRWFGDDDAGICVPLPADRARRAT